MDELSEKLSGILNDPESMERVRKMAESILGSDEKKVSTPSTDLMSTLGNNMPDAETMGRIMQLIGRFKNENLDARSALLLALRPHLSEPRQEKLDTDIKFLKMIALLPLIKERGLFNI